MKKCPKCNKEIEDNVSFCPYCGAKTNEQNSAPSKNNALNVLFIVLFSIFAVLLLVGMFGEVAKQAYFYKGRQTDSTSLSVRYFFGDGAKMLQQVKSNEFNGNGYYPFRLAMFILENIFFFGGVAGLIVSIVFMVMNFVKVVINNQPLKLFPLCGLILSVFPYLFLMSIQHFTHYQRGDEVRIISFGWGAILLLIGSLGTLGAVLAFSLCNVNKTKKNVLDTVLTGLVPIITLSMVAFTMWGIAFIDGRHPITNQYQCQTYNPYYLVELYLSLHETNILPANFGSAMTGFVLILLSGLVSISSLVFVFKKKQLLTTLFVSVGFVLFVVGSIQSYFGFKNNGGNGNWILGVPAIVGYFLGGLAIVALITSLVMQRKQKAE